MGLVAPTSAIPAAPPLIRLRRWIARAALPPVLFRASGFLRPALRAPLQRPVRDWLWTHILRPYTIDAVTPRVAQTVFGARLAGTTRDFVFHHVWMFGVWEPHLTRYLWERLRPGDTYVDVGGNVGYFALLGAAKVGPHGRVVTFEPLPTSMATLRRNLALNGLENVRTVEVAASDSEGTAPFFVERLDDACGASLLRDPSIAQTRLDVRTHTLAALLDDDEIARATTVKIDVEGAELAVVTGLVPIVERLRPDVELVVEMFSGTFERIRALLAPFGFHPYVLPNPYALTDPAIDSGLRPRRLPETASSASLSKLPSAYVVFSRRDAAAL